jgi:isopenicillin-N N-acyltransferase-like protein
MTYPHVRATGSPQDRGRAYGRAARDRIAASVDGYATLFSRRLGWHWSQARREARRFLPAIEALGGGYVEELVGMADGAGLDLDDLLALNCRTEIGAIASVRDGVAPGRADGCSAVAVLPGSTADGATIAAQNWDWYLHARTTLVVLEVERDDGPGYVTVVEAGLPAKAGMNAAGLAVLTNFLITSEDGQRTGVPYHVVLRALMDRASVAEAVRLLCALDRASSANYLLADAGGAAVDVEAAPGTATFSHEPTDGLLAHTNHFVDARCSIDLAASVVPSSAGRLRSLGDGLRAAAPVTVEDVQGALRDHAGHPFGVCSHPDPAVAAPEQEATIASVVMVPETHSLWVADGTPCVQPYRRLDLALS